MIVASRALRVSSAALLLGAALLLSACGEKSSSREASREAVDSVAAARTGQITPPEWWGDLADSVLGSEGLHGFGATWTEVTATLGQPASVQFEIEDEDTLFVADYVSSGADYAGAIRPLLFEFRSTSGGVRKLTRAYWQIRDADGSRALPKDHLDKADKVAARLQSWGTRLDAIEAVLGPGFPDSLPTGEVEHVDGLPFAVHFRRDYPGMTFRFGEDSTLFGAEWTGSKNLVDGFRAGMTRYQVLTRVGLPWASTNDSRNVARTNPEPSLPRWKGQGDSTVIWLYVLSEEPLDYLVFSMRQDKVTSISWWTAGEMR